MCENFLEIVWYMFCLRVNNNIKKISSDHVTSGNLECIDDDNDVYIILILTGWFFMEN